MTDAPSLPSPLLLIADGFVTGTRGLSGTEVQEQTRALVEWGVRWVLFRDHAAAADGFAETAERFARRLVATRPDVALSTAGHPETARAIGAGIHVGWRGPSVRDVPDLVVGVSAHSVADAQAAEQAGADYVTLSPLFPTRSHPEARSLGLDALWHCAEAVSIPVVALGGITPERARPAREAGASGVAAISSLLLAPDPEATVAAFSKALGWTL